MAVRTAVVSVGTTPTEVTGGDADSVPGTRVYVHNASGTVSVFVGGSNITTDNGLPVAAGATSPPFDLGSGEQLFAVVVGPTAENVRVLRLGA